MFVVAQTFPSKSRLEDRARSYTRYFSFFFCERLTDVPDVCYPGLVTINFFNTLPLAELASQLIRYFTFTQEFMKSSSRMRKSADNEKSIRLMVKAHTISRRSDPLLLLHGENIV